ncbi:uncharacterized protein LOC143064429 [Mytilus galloprovincialis]|uniref:uncharacterized protein LOC143064429 n=1 Tax=Mytilus galloprovincialis TaxID=29158 RepID=UPI003F7B60E4
MAYFIKMFLFSFLMSGIITFVSCTLCGVKICRRQYRDSDYIECNTGRILIENVTQIDTTEDEWALKSLRRICTGKTTKCDVHQICQDPRIQNLRVTYTCNDLPNSEPANTCTSGIKVLTQSKGFIFSPRYPNIVTLSCSWMVVVPDKHFAILRLHDLERPSVDRDSGLQIRTTRNCPNNDIPPGLVYEMKGHTNVYQACGDVDIDLVTNGISGLRFWISYEVIPLARNINVEYKAMYSCPDGTRLEQESQHALVMRPDIPPILITRKISFINSTVRTDNETAVETIERKESEQFNTAERMIFYVAIAIAFLSVQALIIVVVVCIRRQRHLKANGPIIDHSSIPSTFPSPFNRPLPPVQPQHQQLSNSPSLMDGYGIVADEIDESCYEQSFESSAYAEVDDTLPYRSNINAYSMDKPKLHDTVENVYSELKDNERGGYCEIADTVWHNGPLPRNDQAKLIKPDTKIRRSQCSNYSGKSRKSSFDGPFSHFDEHRKSHMTCSEQSDSEDSLFGNEQYDYIESVHV